MLEENTNTTQPLNGTNKNSIPSEISNKLQPARGPMVSASTLGRVLPWPCKLVLQPSYQVHGVRKSCREDTQSTKKRVNWNH